jgi:hypothetical protein
VTASLLLSANVTAPSLLILGTDAVLAASPATPVQLAHACLAVGYRAVIPASWGDELIASHVLDRLRDRPAPRLLCSCPNVARRLEANGESIADSVVATVSPPVAAALYLRAAHAPADVRITFVGGCAAGSHPSIDTWLTVSQLRDAFAERAIDPMQQPTEFDSIIPPDRRRYFSEPGGLPTRRFLRELERPAEVADIRGAEFVTEIAQQLLEAAPSLIDASHACGCVCSGALLGVAREYARARVREHEPPRAPSPVVDTTILVQIGATIRNIPVVAPSAAAAPVRASASESAAPTTTATPPDAPVVPARRRSPGGVPRMSVSMSAPTRADEERQLPRAYVAHRRSSPRGMRQSQVGSPLPATLPPEGPAPGRKAWVRWALVAGAGVIVGLVLGWAMRLARVFAP